MSTAQQLAQVVIPRVQAQALADALSRKGFTTTVLASGGHQAHPCVHAVHRYTWNPVPDIYIDHRCGTRIYLAPEDGQWWFWWPTLEPIAPATDIATTADTIARALRTAPAAPPGHGTCTQAAPAPGTSEGAA